MEIYLDNASTTQVLEEVMNEIMLSFSELYGDTQNSHKYSLKSQVKIEECRRKIAKLVNCNSEDIIFTSGGTEANNLAIFGAIRKNHIKTVVCSPVEHDSVIKPLEYLREKGEIKLHFLKLDNQMNINISELEEFLSVNPNSFVSLAHSNYFTGSLLPIKKVAGICKKHNAIFHSDMVQSMAYLKNDFHAMGIDLATVSAHKFHGPKAVGFLYIKQGLDIENLIFGEKNEYLLRPGTENIYGIIGMTKAFEIMQETINENYSICLKFKKNIIAKFTETDFPFEIIGNPLEKSLPNILTLNFPTLKNTFKLLQKMSVFELDGTKIKFLNLHPGKKIRFSFSFKNSIDEVEKINFNYI
jgi:cysteine desulfurase